MVTTFEKPNLATSGDGDSPLPPDEVAVSNGDGEGDGRHIAEGLSRIEAYANYSNVLELSGIKLAEAVYGIAKHNAMRSQFAIPTGRLTVRNEMPLFLN